MTYERRISFSLPCCQGSVRFGFPPMAIPLSAHRSKVLPTLQRGHFVRPSHEDENIQKGGMQQPTCAKRLLSYLGGLCIHTIRCL